MEEQKDTLALLEKMEHHSRRQLRLTRLTCIFLALTTLCCIVLFLLFASLWPRFSAVTQQMNTVLGNLETVSRELAATDLKDMISNVESLVLEVDGLIGNVDGLVDNAQESLRQTMDKLNTLDLTTLNQAVKDLAAVVKPLADFFNIFH